MNPPINLETEVFEKIEGALEKQNRQKKIFGWSFFILLTIVLVPIMIYTFHEFQESGFYNYSSLAFSDTQIIFNNLNDFILSVTDSIPFLSITVILSVIFFLLLSLRYAGDLKRQFFYKKIN
jgi:hypothetical protein